MNDPYDIPEFCDNHIRYKSIFQRSIKVQDKKNLCQANRTLSSQASCVLQSICNMNRNSSVDKIASGLCVQLIRRENLLIDSAVIKDVLIQSNVSKQMEEKH